MEAVDHKFHSISEAERSYDLVGSAFGSGPVYASICAFSLVGFGSQ